MQKKEIFLKDYQAPEFLIDKVDLTLTLKDGTKSEANSIYKVRKNPESNSNNTFKMQADELELISIKLNNQHLSPEDYSFNGCEFSLKNAPEEFTFEINTKFDAEHNTTLMGIYKSHGMFCSQCEAEGFRKITLHPDRPDVMSEYTTTIIADKTKYPVLLSNGNKIEEKDLENNLHMVKWHDPFKKPSYLFAAIAGNLDCLEDTFTTKSGRKVALKIFTENKNINKAGFAMMSLKKAMLFDEEEYGREYDLDTFMIVAVDHFNFGAMENKGLNIFQSSVILATPKTTPDHLLEYIQNIIGHEYFHNWSGNRITCRDWFQLSLKEGFTVFRESQFGQYSTQGIRSLLQLSQEMKTLQFAEDSSPMAHPVQPQSYQEIDNFYTRTVYIKGSEVIRMYQTLLGKECFKQGCDLYFETFDGQAATIDDFLQCMEKVSGLSLEQFKLWYTQEGTPTLKIEESYSNNSKTFYLKIKQQIKEGQKPFLIPIKLGLIGKQGQELSNKNIIILNDIEQTFEFHDINERPITSILRDFSAPVKLDFQQSTEDLIFLAKYDSNVYNKKSALNRIFLNEIKNIMISLQEKKEPSINKELIRILRHIMIDESISIAALPTLLKLPSKQILKNFIQPIDPILQIKAKQVLKEAIAKELYDDFQYLLNQHYKEDKPYEFNALEIAKRDLILTCLDYVFTANEEENLKFVKALFNNANNYTYESGAFELLLESGDKNIRDNAIYDFYNKWNHDSLVIEDWFKIQAVSRKVGTLERIKELTEHPDFDITNATMVRYVMKTFSNNSWTFHNEESYQFFADFIIKLDEINPIMTAELLKRIINYKEYNKYYANMLLKQLIYINENVSSAATKEILEKTLTKKGQQ